MTDKLERREPDEPRRLVAHPQRLGLVPTWWFWRGENWRLARVPVGVGVFVIMLGFGLAGLSPTLAVVLPPLVFVVGLGLFERHIRRRARRRSLPAAGDEG